MILGVDISTSITGFAIVADGQLLYYDSVDLRKYKSFFEKAEVIKNKLTDIFEAYQCNNDTLVGESQFPIEYIYISLIHRSIISSIIVLGFVFSFCRQL